VWPGDKSLATLLLGQLFESWWLIGEEAMQCALRLSTGKEHADTVIDKVGSVDGHNMFMGELPESPDLR
jgi:hypothetical protein